LPLLTRVQGQGTGYRGQPAGIMRKASSRLL
jgi:hypothetical protein